MRSVFLLAFVLSFPSFAAAEGPRLAVVVVVDQMRADYLDRYAPWFDGGLRRMLDSGRRFPDAWVDHALTNSLPGHLSIITGAYPFRHGVVDNVWHEVGSEGPEIVSGYDLVTGLPDAARHLDATTLPQWAVAADASARFVALGSSTNSPRLYAGGMSGPVLWLDAEQGGFATSEPFAAAVPSWAAQFQRAGLPRIVAQDWECVVPEAVRAGLRPDASTFENRGEEIAFPHRGPDDPDTRSEWFYDSPLADEATLELAAIAVEAEKLGQDDVPDILTLALNSLDQIGHAYGPFSLEQTDAIFRLDRNLGRLMAELDRLVGEGRWVLALTADHGVAVPPEESHRHGSIEGNRILREEAQRVVDAAYLAVEGLQDRGARATAAAAAVTAFPFVERVFTETELAAATPGTDSAIALYARSFRPGRIPVHPFYIRDPALADLGVVVQLKEDVMMDWGTAIHGSPYDYDRRVPLVFYGAGVTPGVDPTRVATVDVAPTLARLLGIQPIGPVDGAALRLD